MTMNWMDMNDGKTSVYNYYQFMWDNGLREFFLEGKDGPKDFSEWQ